MTTETTTLTASDLVAAARAKADASDKANKANRAAQQAARVILADGMSELAKVCRRFVAAQGAGAEEATATLVLSLLQIAEAASTK